MEDSAPAPNGYMSGGLVVDMAIHNVDEVLWLTGEFPHSALMIGSRLYSHRLTTAQEDFDDALLYLWFENELAAQIQVAESRFRLSHRIVLRRRGCDPGRSLPPEAQ